MNIRLSPKIEAFLGADEVTLAALKSEAIEVEFCELQPPEFGFYAWHPETNPVIGLAHRLKFDRVLLRSVLWEGLGFHATVPDPLRPTPFVLRCTMLRGAPEPLENAALRWAATRLISRDEIRWWLRTEGRTLGHTLGRTIDDFARTFKVTPEIARERLLSLQPFLPDLWQELHV
ncbi:MAG: hypothetical protein J0I20_32095 [Chloroflexi bacterium]|nr:hypothetical protein [Chloroflexota bacterium]OJV93282.1 MAG: hypothetical protein BGO39_15090 [Chloroflexi bacterium 54-19]